MTGATDMSTPVTRGELREELARLEHKLDQKFDQKLEIWGNAFLARLESSEQRLIDRIDSSERRLLAELARHTRASHEETLAQVSIIDEKYADLPPRVGRIETKVFAPKRR